MTTTNERPMVVLCHGSGGSGHSYDDLRAVLGERVDLRTPTLPGHADAPGEPLTTVAEAAEWVWTEVGGAEAGPVVVGGHSVGGAIALELALRHPVAGLVLLATGARLRVHPLIIGMMAQAARDGVHPPTPPGLFHKSTPPEVVARVEARGTSTPPAAALADWRMANAFDRMRDLGRVSAPALVLCGDEDRLTPPKYSRFLAENIAGARLQVLERAGHLFPLERPAEVAAALVEFLGDIDEI